MSLSAPPMNSGIGLIVWLIFAASCIAAAAGTNPDGDLKLSEHRNKLADETSPYLLQHASNPVDWYPWGEEALSRARQENKPIFLSIGYSACHWCHVMERESFENDSIAALMNKYFINIKVDREERPDLDDYYMTFVQMTTGGGGWPMSVFLTPEGKPFFGGTYFPPVDAHGRRGFPSVLKAVAEVWANERARVLESSEQLFHDIQANIKPPAPTGGVGPEVIDTAVEQMLDRFDPLEGGFGDAPKFPPSFALSLMMKQYHRSHNLRFLKAVTFTLDKMANGGIYDQLGGGFHRYSVDSLWLVPHFEKMLYDNALLASTYAEAYQLERKPLYLRIVTEILDYVLRDMTDTLGGFHSAEDADSEGEEGKFYVWTPEEIIDALGSADGKMLCDYYDVTNAGNFDGTSILYPRVPLEQFAESYKISPDELDRKMKEMRAKLLDARSRRIRPNKDDKVLAEWNGLTLTALSRGYQVTGDNRFLEAAVRCARFIESTMIVDGDLMRVYRAGRAKQNGFLSDYAFLSNGLIDLYESSFDIHWLKLADTLAQQMIERFADSQAGGFFMTPAHQTDLPTRQKDSYDGAVPSGNSVAAMALLRLSVLLYNKEYEHLAEKTITSLSTNVSRAPLAFMNLLNACDFDHFRPKEIAVVGRLSDPSTRKFLQAIYSQYLPNRVIALLDPTSRDKSDVELMVPLLKDRPLIADKPTVYICKDFVCKLPATTHDALLSQLQE